MRRVHRARSSNLVQCSPQLKYCCAKLCERLFITILKRKHPTRMSLQGCHMGPRSSVHSKPRDRGASGNDIRCGPLSLSANRYNMASRTIETQIIIVGAGPAGLTLTQGLQKRQIPFHVIERGAGDRHRGYAFRAMDDAVDTLQETWPADIYELSERTRLPPHSGGDYFLHADTTEIVKRGDRP